MKHYETSARITLWAGRGVSVLVILLLPLFPMLINIYHLQFRPLSSAERIAIIAGFYACAPAVLWALRSMEFLLRNILKAELFIEDNVNHIRSIRWCCLAVSIICLAASFGFPSLVFLSVIMAFLCLVINVVGQVMKAAVTIQEENDLTV